jgi:putative redox protein
MITAGNDATATRSKVSNGVHAIEADTKPPLGRSEGLGPHELLEASLASCLAITLRMVAMERGIALKQLRVRVELDRTDPAKTVFRSTVELDDDLAPAERRVLMAAARLCPVRKTLSKSIAFEGA